MSKLAVVFFFLPLCVSCQAQTNSTGHRTKSPDFDHKIESYLDFSVPIITVGELQPKIGEYILLDAREPEEYEVSHIRNAQNIGYKNVDLQSLDVSKDAPIVIYCSIGYRSEKIGEKLKKQGYTLVYNLYGSIFEWVNQGNPVFDMNGDSTKRIHTYSKKWSIWVDKEGVEKIW